MQCPVCQSEARKFGRDRDGNQRYQCQTCRKLFADRPARLLGDMRISLDKALVCLHHLVEGCSVRATMRLTGTNRNTILDLLALMGERCERLLSGRVKNVPVLDVQCDEVWAFIGMKEKAKKRKGYQDVDGIGDAYTFIAVERTSKLILAWHLGRRSGADTREFARKLADATTGHFQISTDQFPPYKTAIPEILGDADFAMLIKHYATVDNDQRQYSPGEVIATTKRRCCGRPDMDRVCTSHVERQNLTVRMQNRRLTRLTNAFSKKWANHNHAMALHFAYVNFCHPHGTLTKERGYKCTPAMAAGLEDHVWTIGELVAKSTHS
jgi:transposase-like protein/IS1 family transposase